jgi:uncharacterized protein (TIGR02996 family)
MSDAERAFVRQAESHEGAELIYADWLDEQGRCAEAAALRDRSGESGFSESYGSGSGYGYGDGSSYGYGSGSGYGDGSGDGSGSGDGDGSGSGYGDGSDYG